MAEPETQTKKMRRDDPPPRPVEGLANRGFLQNADPGKHYVWVSQQNDPTFNIAYYRSLGYKKAQYDEGEVQPTLGNDEFKQGDVITSMGMVLMECSADHKRELDQQGWKEADALQEQIRNRDIDPLNKAEFRGITTARMSKDTRRAWQF